MLPGQQPSPPSTPYPFTGGTTTHQDDGWWWWWARAGRRDSRFLSRGWSRQGDINSLPPGLHQTVSSPCDKDLPGICYQSHPFLTAAATGHPPTTTVQSRNPASIPSGALQGAQGQNGLAQSPEGPTVMTAPLRLWDQVSVWQSTSRNWAGPCLQMLSRTSKPRACFVLARFPRHSMSRVPLSPDPTALRKSSLSQRFSNIRDPHTPWGAC